MVEPGGTSRLRGSETTLVRAVVVNYNGAALLPACLDSLLSQANVALDIWVVDNASSDGSVELLARDYPTVHVLSLPENTGFAGGMAAATADLLDNESCASSGSPRSIRAERETSWGEVSQDLPTFIALLNNDARFAPDAISQMLTTMNTDPRIGAVTATVLLDNGTDDLATATVQSTGNVLTSTGAMDRDYGTPLRELHASPDVFGFNGGASLLRVEALREVGGFDASYFLYYEDTDLSFRLRAAGWTVHYAREAIAWHRHMASTDGGTSPVFRYYNTRNSLRVFRRHRGWVAFAASAARQTMGAIKASVTRSEPREVRTARWQGLRNSLQ